MTKEMKRPISNITQDSIKPLLSNAVEFYTNKNREAHKCIQERDEYINYLESKLSNARPQQALPVVPECVAEFVSGDENEFSKADRIAYLLQSVQGDSYYLTKELPGDGMITVDEGQELYNWAICQHHETILKLWNGYTVEKPQIEKPQLFYLKAKELLVVGDYDHVEDLWLDCNKNFTPKKQDAHKFTQEEIDSMQTGSYEQIAVPVEDGE